MFLDHVFHMISNDEFDQLRRKNIDISHVLQSIETRMFYQSRDMDSLIKRSVTSVVQTATRKKEANKLGVRVEINCTVPDMEEGSVPSLQTLCANVLVKNGLPQAYVRSVPSIRR